MELNKDTSHGENDFIINMHIDSTKGKLALGPVKLFPRGKSLTGLQIV